MTEKWDELWTRDIPAIEREDWLYEVKAEGDALKEKVNELKDWERIAREQADTLLRQHANLKRLEEKILEERA